MIHFSELAQADAAEEEALRDACLEGRIVSQSDVRDNRQRGLDDAVRGLVQKGILIFQDGFYRLPPNRAEEFIDDMVDYKDAT